MDDLPVLSSQDEWGRIGMTWRRLTNIWLGRWFLWQGGLIRAALSREFSVLIFFGDMRYLSTWFAAIAARLTGKRVLMWGHGFVRSRLSVQEAIRTLFYRLAHGHLLYGHRAREIMTKRGFDPRTLYVIYNSLDTGQQGALRATLIPERLRAERVRLFGEPDLPLLITVGRLVARKDTSLLLVAASEMAKAGHKVNLLVAGDGPDRERLESVAKELGLQSRTLFTGAIYDEAKLAPLIGAADLCVVPGTIGLTCMHAFAYGTPVITHSDFDAQNPEVEAIMPGRTGAFFTRGDAADLARVITAWIAAGRSREEVRRACVRMIERFYNPEKQAEIIDLAVENVPATEVEDASRPLPLAFAEVKP